MTFAIKLDQTACFRKPLAFVWRLNRINSAKGADKTAIEALLGKTKTIFIKDLCALF